MADERNYPIENLKDRLKIFCDFVPHDGDYLRDPKKRAEKAKFDDLLGLIVKAKINDRPDFPSAVSWRAWLGGRDVPESAIQGILKIFPSVPKEMLVTEKYSDFLNIWSYAAASASNWKDASIKVMEDRNRYSDIAYQYYTGINAPQNDLPLIVRPGWILGQPQELRRDDPPPRVVDLPDVSGRPLSSGGLVSYTFLKKAIAAEKVQRRLWDGTSYRVMEIEAADSHIDFVFSRGSYYKFLDTSEILGAELALAEERAADRGGSLKLEDIPRRGIPSDAFKFYMRSVPLGVNCITILKNFAPKITRDGRTTALKKGTYFLMHHRRTDVIEAQNVWHLVPAGGHQPIGIADPDHWQANVWCTVAREFLEECLGVKAADEQHSGASGFFENDAAKPRLDALFSGSKPAAKTFLLGVGLDPLNLKPEALVAIVVDWERTRRNLVSNIALEIKENYEGQITYVELYGPETLLERAKPFEAIKVQPSGNACLRQAARHYDILMNSV